MRTEKKHRLAQLRHWRVRSKIQGTKERPRMSVRFTNQNIYVQFVDDTAGATLAAASTLSKEARDGGKLAANVKSAQAIGKLAATAALAKGIKEVVFDRAGARYHQSKSKDGKLVCGKLATLANAARAAGLKF